MTSNLHFHGATISTKDKAIKNKHRPAVLWFTGLSGSGKSTLANAVECLLFQRGYQTHTLDGDNIRMGLNSDLGFSPEDRTENIRRISEVANLMRESGTIVCTAFISPYRKSRQSARDIIGKDFIEVYVKAPLETCEDRDPKGLYKKARSGEIPNFTGVSAPYENPENPEVVVETHESKIDDCAEQIIKYLEDNKYF